MTIVPNGQNENKSPDKRAAYVRPPAVGIAGADKVVPDLNNDSGLAQKNNRQTLLSAQENPGDQTIENSLRPRFFSEYIGQQKLKEWLSVSMSAAKGRGDALDHVLFYGPPGLGKTTLARIIANEMGTRIFATSGPALERPRDILGLVHQLEKNDVLFIDEVHRLSRIAEELLYPALEDFVIDLNTGKGAGTRTMRLPLPKFTLIAATTRAGMIANALRDRFGFICRLEFYSNAELGQIIARSASLLELNMEEQAIAIIAARARGTPRIANRLIRLARDFSQYKGKSVITAELAYEALNVYQVDELGLDQTDRRLLEILIDHYAGGPVGVETLAATLGEDSATIEEICEPFLIQQGFLQRTARGRLATPLAYKHLRREFKGIKDDMDLAAEDATTGGVL
jgi:holliday junction DNA helicase RuvB